MNEEEDEMDDGERLLENKMEEDLSQMSQASLGDKIRNFLKKPQGMAIAGLVGLFLVFVLISVFSSLGGNKSGNKSSEKSKTQNEQGLIETPIKPETIEIVPDIVSAPPKAPELDNPSIPDIGNFELPKPKEPESVKKPEAVVKAPEPEIAFEEPPFEEEIPFAEPEKKLRKRDDKNPLPPMYNLSGTGPSDTDQGRSKRAGNDFIFMGGDIPAEEDESYLEPKKIAALENTIAQGRNIDAVLETAINSEIPGTVRAVVSRDVYAEISENVLIPKGSRLYGNYKTLTNRGQSRIAINFVRIIRPDGITADVSSFASDQFGRAGVQGEVDRKYAQLLGLTFMEAFIDIGVALALNQIANNSQQQLNLNSAGGNQFIVPNPSNQVATTLTRSIQNRTKEVAQDMVGTNPVVSINQGTRINIMVNQDLRLPVFKPIKSSYRAVNYYQSSSFYSGKKSEDGGDIGSPDGRGDKQGYKGIASDRGVQSAAPGG